MVRCAVFDFDNTLVKSEVIKVQNFYDVISHIENGDEIMTEIFDIPDRGDRFDIFRMFAERIEPTDKEKAAKLAKELTYTYTHTIEHKVSNCVEILGATSALKKLHEHKIKLYINSATPEESLRKTLNMRGWDHVFDDIFGRPRSKVENLKKIADITGLKPEEIVMVGDGDNDREAAEDFGSQFIGLDFGNFTKPIMKKAQNMTEVADIIIDMILATSKSCSFASTI